MVRGYFQGRFAHCLFVVLDTGVKIVEKILSCAQDKARATRLCGVGVGLYPFSLSGVKAAFISSGYG